MPTPTEVIQQMIDNAPDEIENLQSAIEQLDSQIEELQNKMDALDSVIGDKIEQDFLNYVKNISQLTDSSYYFRETSPNFGNMLNVDGQITDWEIYKLISFQTDNTFQIEYEIEIKTGTLTIQIPSHLDYVINSVIYIIHDIYNQLKGKITTCDSETGSLEIDISNIIGSGTYNTWSVILSSFSSSSEMEISIGSKTFELIYYEPILLTEKNITLEHDENILEGSLISYNSETNEATINITEVEGSGTYNTWNLVSFSTNTETLSFSTGTKSITIDNCVLYSIGQNIHLKHDDDNYISGTITNVNASENLVLLNITESYNSNEYGTLRAKIFTNSTNNLTLSYAYKFFTIDPNLLESFNIPMLLKHDDDNYMDAIVCAHISNTFYIQSLNAVGSGVFNSWTMSMFSESESSFQLKTSIQSIIINRGPIISNGMSVLLKKSNYSVTGTVVSYTSNTSLLTLSPTVIETPTTFNIWTIIFTANSSSSLTFGTGLKVFTVNVSLIHRKLGMTVKISKSTDLSQYMIGTLSYFTSSSNQVEVTESVGSGTYTSWIVEFFSSSTSEISVGSGPKTLTVDTGLSTTISKPIIIKYSDDIYMQGTTTTYDSETGLMTVNITTLENTESSTVWDVEFYFYSTSSLAIGLGIKSFSKTMIPIFTNYFSVEVKHQSSTKMIGRITSYNSETGETIFNPTSVTGTGTFDSWDISIYTDELSITHNYQTRIHNYTLISRLPLHIGSTLSLVNSETRLMSGSIISYEPETGNIEINITNIVTPDNSTNWDIYYTYEILSELEVSTGEKQILLPQLVLFLRNQIIIANDVSNKMQGMITSFNTETKEITVDIEEITGSGTYDLWSISIGKSVHYLSSTSFQCDGDQSLIFTSGTLVSYLLGNTRGFATVTSSNYALNCTTVLLEECSRSLTSSLTSIWIQVDIGIDSVMVQFYNDWNFAHDYIWKEIGETGTYGMYELKSNFISGRNILTYNKTKLENSLIVLPKYIEE